MQRNLQLAPGYKERWAAAEKTAEACEACAFLPERTLDALQSTEEMPVTEEH